jgi:predicted site-specific integrase-resolvase
MEEYVNTKEAKELLRVTATTLRRWDKEGKIQVIRTPSGIRMYNKKCIREILGQVSSTQPKQNIIYCRVSSKKQVNDLERQKDFLRSNYPNHKLVSDIGSGINFKRKGLQKILELAMQGKVGEVVVSNRDRLCRFGFDLIEWILSKTNTKLMVFDKTDTESSSEELSKDILAIIHVFSCREMGKRRYKSTKAKTPSDKSTKAGP